MSEIRDKRSKPIFIHSELDDLGLDPYTFRIYARLARRAGDGLAFESVPSMATACRMSERKVRDALKELAERRMVMREDRAGRTSVYVLTDKVAWAVPLADPTGVESATPCRSDRGPLADPTDEGTPLKVIPKDDDDDARARENFDLSFLSEDQSIYAPTIVDVLSAYPDHTGASFALRKIFPRAKSGWHAEPVLLGWVQDHTWPEVVAALVIAADGADGSYIKYAHKVLKGFSEDGTTTTTWAGSTGRSGGAVYRNGTAQPGTSANVPQAVRGRPARGAAPAGGRQKRDGELSNYEYLIRCGYTPAEAEQLTRLTADTQKGRSDDPAGLLG